MRPRALVVPALICIAALPAPVSATFSLVACDPEGSCGAAVATNNLAVGSTVIHARAEVGALATQFETNPGYGPKGLSLLAGGAAPADVIERLLAEDGDFDGTTVAHRQVGLVGSNGKSAAYTGDAAMQATWAGSRNGDGYSIQGNGLASGQVVSAMERAFLSSPGTLAERLVAGLEAGQSAGGQTTGKLSAALLVRTPAGDWNDIDLRVDAAAEPVRDLHRLMDMHYARQAIIRAERQADRGRTAEAKASMKEALQRSRRWDRIWRRAARLAMRMGDTDEALKCLGVFRGINPAWAELELQDPLYRAMREDARFRAWLSKKTR
ncbi:DUF1028 domain-containing protein [Luteimonas sp. R10]|uniref:DUF1028 domain-containing protein n=1 Tax=Luteimonas sp. R10 TaxID=3108176 RepID=UPI00308E4BFD|nr:DUF1028 domain-containing protein [Luteimonas sp. R10]